MQNKVKIIAISYLNEVNQCSHSRLASWTCCSHWTGIMPDEVAHLFLFFLAKGNPDTVYWNFKILLLKKKNIQKTNTVSHCMVEKWLINSNKITNAFSPFLNRSTGLLDSGMLVNIQQPLIRDDGTVLMATDTKVALLYHLFTKLLFYYM